MKQWKASEFRAWLLYYCIPVLSDILPADYIYHLSLLVAAMHILLGDAIPSADIDTAHELLQRFYSLTPKLYSRSICTANMHLLIHLSECVRNWGLLWVYSCFGFESMNGHLRKSCHGTGYVLPQLVHNVRMRQTLTSKGKKIAGHADPNVAAFISSLTDIHERTSELEIKSRVRHKQLENEVVNALKAVNIIDQASSALTLPVCKRIRYNSTIYATAPQPQRSRNGSICVFNHNSELHFGSILEFCYCNGGLFAIVDRFECIDQTLFDHIRSSTLSELTLSTCSKITEFIHCVKKLSHTGLLAVPVSSIFAKCVHIPVRGAHFDYIITMPNMFEHH